MFHGQIFEDEQVGRSTTRQSYNLEDKYFEVL